MKILYSFLLIFMVSCGAEQPSSKTTAAELDGKLISQSESETKEVRVASPDGAIVFNLQEEKGQLFYQVAYQGEPLIGQSALGLRFKTHHAFETNLKIIDVSNTEHDDVWEQPWGENHFVRNHYNEAVVKVKSGLSGGVLIIRVRLFDDGLGFRYEMPIQPDFTNVQIVNELTEFMLPEQAVAWWIPARKWNRYEYLYQKTPIRDMGMVHTPVTLRTQKGVHLSIHEAALVDYSGMSLEPMRDTRFKANLAPSSSGVLVSAKTPFVTPWRTIQIANDATGLINSSLILNLNEPNKLGDVSWVEPGKYIGIWWAMHIRDRSWGTDGIHGATTDETIRYMKFAAKYGFKGVLVEGWNKGWDGDWYLNGDLFSFTESYPDFDIEKIAAFGKKVGVRLIGHHETSGSLSNYEKQMAAGFALYEKNGVRQVKTGYVADAGGLKWVDDKGVAHFEFHDGQYAVNHHLRVLKEAAKHKISINTHEPVKDTGLRRTYPNWISREGARGSEYDAWAIPPNTPAHTATIPYTRMLSGPMDYTPGIFELRPSELPPVREDMHRNSLLSRIETTLMKQLALYVVLYSPIQMAADLPSHYEARPDAFQFILDVPVDWERSIALQGEVGDYIIMARQERDGDDWYIGALTNEQARDVNVTLDFLNKGQSYTATIYRDGPKADYETAPYDYIIETKTVTNTDRLLLHMAPSGGFAIKLDANTKGAP
ncbi:MAG: glycoside hydrolase family 97 protein [bacterium]